MASRRGPDNSVRVSVVGAIRGQTCANIFHAQLTTSGSITQTDLDTWTTSFAAAFKTRFQASLPTDYAINYVKAVLYAPGGLELVSTVTPTAWSGSGGAASPIGATCTVLSWVSGVYWRGGKPRTYLPVASNQITAGTDLLSTASRTASALAGTNFKSDVNALTSGTITGTAMGFVSFRSGNAERGTPLFFTIVGCIVHPRVGSQRRRDGKWQN